MIINSYQEWISFWYIEIGFWNCIIEFFDFTWIRSSDFLQCIFLWSDAHDIGSLVWYEKAAMFSILLLLPAGSVRPSGNLLYNGVLLLQNIRTISTLLLKHIITLFYTFSLRYWYQQKMKVNKIIHSSRKVLVAK